MDVRVSRGQILLYRVFDIGTEIDLEKVESLFENSKERFRLDRKHNMSLAIPKAPVLIQLGKIKVKVAEIEQECDLVAKVWHFGALSLCFKIPIMSNSSWDDLISIASWIDKDTHIDDIALNIAKDFQGKITSAIPELNDDWSLYEDYVTYHIQEFSGLDVPLSKLHEKVDVASLLLAENGVDLADAIRKMTLESSYQYTNADLVVVDWNSALVVEPTASMDVPLIIEFALNQLLEVRYYDDLLDTKLNKLYNSVVEKKKSLWNKEYTRLAEEAGQMYIEISEIVENVENSFKAVGDFYLAQIFRASSKRFRFDDWQRSINEKLSNLAAVSKLLHSEINESRNQLMEFTIIVLIAVEVIPLLYTWIF